METKKEDLKMMDDTTGLLVIASVLIAIVASENKKDIQKASALVSAFRDYEELIHKHWDNANLVSASIAQFMISAITDEFGSLDQMPIKDD